MASTCMHLYVGRSLLRNVDIAVDTAQYYLGCIAPDSVNLDGFAPKETRWAAHLRSASLTQWYENAAMFWRNHADTDGLALGYTIHILTDVAWDEYFHDAIWAGMRELRLPSLMGEEPGWEDCFRFDHDQFAAPWWTDEVCPALKCARPAAVNTISADLLARYRDHITKLYPHTIPEGKPHMVTAELVDALADLVLQKSRTLLSLQPNG